MNTSADHFDEPPDSPNHAMLRETAWIGGALTEGRYFLSWATGVNHFRQKDEEYEQAYREYVIQTWPGSQAFLRSTYWMRFFLLLLRHRYSESKIGKSFPYRSETKEEEALRTLLTNPSLLHAELARDLKTTEKQLLRMPELQLAYRELS